MPEVHVYMAAGRTDEQKKGMMLDITQRTSRQPRRFARGRDSANHRGATDRQDEKWPDFRGAGQVIRRA